jgi:hypothetical protein
MYTNKKICVCAFVCACAYVRVCVCVYVYVFLCVSVYVPVVVVVPEVVSTAQTVSRMHFARNLRIRLSENYVRRKGKKGEKRLRMGSSSIKREVM